MPRLLHFQSVRTEAYHAFLPLEEKLIPKVLQYAVEAFGRDEFEKILDDATASSVPRDIALNLGPPQAVFIAMAARDGNGQTLWDEWASRDWVGLSNDERLLAESQSRSFVTICEIQQILDDHRILCADLLDPKGGQFLLFDSQIAKRSRFDRFLTRLCTLPNFARPIGMPLSIEHGAVAELIALIENCLKQSKKQDPAIKTVKDWLFYNLPEAVRWLCERASEQREAMLSNIDLHQCVATYRMVASRADIEAIFRSRIDFEPIEAKEQPPFPKPLTAFLWLRRGESKVLEDQMPPGFQHNNPEEEGWGIVGHVRIYEDRVQIDALHKRTFEFAREMLPKYFGSRLELTNETVVDLAKIMRDEPAEDEDLEPMPPTHLVEFVRGDFDGELADLFRRAPQFREQPANEPNSPDAPLALFVWERGETERPILISTNEERTLMLCATEACARFARKTVPRLFGKALQFATERVEDLTPLFEERLNDEVLLSSDAPPVPTQEPSAEQKQILLRMHETHYRKFLDDRVPLLDDHTPREAARDPALRPKLLDLMKFHINGLERRSKADGVCYSVDWLLEELELTELK